MRIVRWEGLKAVPWKNGQGITREICSAAGRHGFAWRLSVADVAGNGPFSKFEGMRRILTVVEGKGMELVGTDSTLQADWGVPVAFEGDMEIMSELKNGPLRDLNLIFDPRVCSGDVSVLSAGESRSLHCRNGQLFAVFCVEGDVGLKGGEQLQNGDTALVESGALDLEVGAFSMALLVVVEKF